MNSENHIKQMKKIEEIRMKSALNQNQYREKIDEKAELKEQDK